MKPIPVAALSKAQVCDTGPEKPYNASNCMLLRKLNKGEDKARVWAVVPKGKNTNESS
jgi:hypothetical protein